MDEDDDVNMKPVTVCKKPGRKHTAKRKIVKKVVSKEETTAPEPDKSKLLTTVEVKILFSKTDETRNKTDMEKKMRLNWHCKLKMVKRALKNQINQSSDVSKKLDEVHH